MSPLALTSVESAGDERLADYRDLTDVALRTRMEPPHGLFIAEGEKVIRRAIRAGFAPRSLLLAPEWLERMAGLLDDIAAPVYVAETPVLEAVTGFHVHRGALAAFHRRPVPSAAEVADAATRLVVLEDVVSHTNLGAIFRCAAALGMDGVVLSPSCADPLYRRSVRVSMGEVFAIPYARATAWPAWLADLRAGGWRVAALTPSADATPLDVVRPADDERVAVLLGTEGPGLTGAALARADLRVRIPMAAGVDSLNVAAAAAITFWTLGRRS
ncbi:MAG TPA: RNA methyltransferase [Mycobacteriales bacterium]|nr:RNA methyltransferase [Mycobacteriales bacterium]